MVDLSHRTLTGEQLHGPFQYEQDTDPGAVGAGNYWLDTNSGPPRQLFRRNAADDGWDLVGDGTGSGTALTVQEIDGTPSDTAVSIIRVTNGKLTDNGAGDVTLDLSGTPLTVQEVDGTPTETPTGILEFPNGTLTEPVAGTVRYTPTAAASGDQIILTLKNDSGESAAVGDVVVISGNDPAPAVFYKQAQARIKQLIGVVQETIADGASGEVCVFGRVDQINLDDTAEGFEYLVTSATAGDATPTYTRTGGGIFGIVLEPGATPPAFIWGWAQAYPENEDQIVLRLQNGSGGGVVASDVVILSQSNALRFATTTTPGQTASVVGVALDTIANLDTGRICVMGRATVTLDASAGTLGYVKTSGTAKRATYTANIEPGVFAQMINTGTSVDCVLFGLPIQPANVGQISTINVVIDGGGDEIADGRQVTIAIDFDCEIEGVKILADQVGSAVVDIWMDTLANYPPTDADSITASAPPTISSDDNNEDTTLTGWTTAIPAGSILRFNVDSCTTITQLTIALQVARSS